MDTPSSSLIADIPLAQPPHVCRGRDDAADGQRVSVVEVVDTAQPRPEASVLGVLPDGTQVVLRVPIASAQFIRGGSTWMVDRVRNVLAPC
jgi:hypothetical protein